MFDEDRNSKQPLQRSGFKSSLGVDGDDRHVFISRLEGEGRGGAGRTLSSEPAGRRAGGRSARVRRAAAAGVSSRRSRRPTVAPYDSRSNDAMVDWPSAAYPCISSLVLSVGWLAGFLRIAPHTHPTCSTYEASCRMRPKEDGGSLPPWTRADLKKSSLRPNSSCLFRSEICFLGADRRKSSLAPHA